MKKKSFMKNIILVLILLSVLLLLPLLKNNNIYEFAATDYILQDSLVSGPYNCEAYFLEKFKQLKDRDHISVMDEIDPNSGNKSEIVTKLLDVLDTFFLIKIGIPDTSNCDLDVASEKISNLTSLIKLTLVSIGSELNYSNYIKIKTSLDNLQVKGNVDNNIITDIRNYLIQNPIDHNLSTTNQTNMNTAEYCKDQNYKDISIYPKCSIT